MSPISSLSSLKQILIYDISHIKKNILIVVFSAKEADLCRWDEVPMFYFKGYHLTVFVHS